MQLLGLHQNRVCELQYRESLNFSMKDVLAWFAKCDEAIALAEKYNLFGGHKGMWIKDIHNI
jgi:hypothetical protein